MATIKLTKRSVEALKVPDPSGKQQLYWDAELKGFGVLVSGVSNAKTFVIQTAVSGKKKRFTVGACNVLSLDEAREKARTLLAGIILTGEDPKKAAKKKERANITLREALDAYFERSPNLSASSVKTYSKVAERHFAPWMDKPLRNITHEAVEQRFRNISRDVASHREAGRTHGGGGTVNGKAIANLAMRLLKAVWNRQAEHDLGLGRNPVDALKRQWHRIDRRDRHIPTERLTEFYQGALALPSAVQRDLVLLGLFTGMRSSEASGLRWDEVDLVQKTIRLPAKRMKAAKPFVLPMSDFVADMLIARRALGNAGGFAFPGNGRAGHSKAFPYALDLIHEATGIKVSPHDMRRTFASVMATCSIPPIAAKMLLAHSTGNDITFNYQILSQEQLREAAQVVCDKLRALCGIADQPEGVILIGGARA
jgi:integrase